MYRITVREDEEYACGEPICCPYNETIYLIACPHLDFKSSVALLCHEIMHEILQTGDWDSKICNELEEWIIKINQS